MRVKKEENEFNLQRIGHELLTQYVPEYMEVFNLLKPNVNCSGRTAPLTSKVAFYIFIQQI